MLHALPSHGSGSRFAYKISHDESNTFALDKFAFSCVKVIFYLLVGTR